MVVAGWGGARPKLYTVRLTLLQQYCTSMAIVVAIQWMSAVRFVLVLIRANREILLLRVAYEQHERKVREHARKAGLPPKVTAA